jgi:hypothetical protein
MSPATDTCMKWCRQTQEEGTKMQVESHPCTKVRTMCTPPLAGQTRDERLYLPGSKQLREENLSKRLRLRHVVTTTRDHERVTAINGHPKQ